MAGEPGAGILRLGVQLHTVEHGVDPARREAERPDQRGREIIERPFRDVPGQEARCERAEELRLAFAPRGEGTFVHGARDQ